MVSLKQLYEWFTTGKFPTELQFQEQFKSFWHKSERLPLTQILGLTDFINKAATKEDLANATTNFKGYHTSLADLLIAHPQVDNRKDFFAWVGSPYPGTVHKVFADKGTWTDTGEVPTQEEIDLSEYAKKIDVNKKADFENTDGDQVVYAKNGKVEVDIEFSEIADSVPLEYTIGYYYSKGSGGKLLKNGSANPNGTEATQPMKLDPTIKYTYSTEATRSDVCSVVLFDHDEKIISFTQNAVANDILDTSKVGYIGFSRNTDVEKQSLHTREIIGIKKKIEKIDTNLDSLDENLTALNDFQNIALEYTKGYYYSKVSGGQLIKNSNANPDVVEATQPIALNPLLKYIYSTISLDSDICSVVLFDHSQQIISYTQRAVDKEEIDTTKVGFIGFSRRTDTGDQSVKSYDGYKFGIQEYEDRLSKLESGDDGTKKGSNLIVCDGDSLTVGYQGNGITYPNTLQALVGNKYRVINTAQGGERLSSILARQGGVPAMLKDGITIPADTSRVKINLVSSISHFPISWFDQENAYPNNSVNPCYLQGVECRISKSGADLYINRVDAGTVKEVPVKSLIYTKASRQNKNCYIASLWVGANDIGKNDTNEEGKKSIDYLYQYIDKMIAFYNPKFHLVFGFTVGGSEENKEFDKQFLERYGLNFLNIREYMSTYAMSDLGLTPTQADNNAMSLGKVPPSLLDDHIHFNANGNKACGQFVYKRLVELGAL